jgi:predicted CoA-binding protein
LSRDGVSVNPEKIQALLDWPAPKSVTEIRQFVGLANVFRKFVDNLSTIAKPLTDLTKANIPYLWGAAQQNAFEALSGSKLL